MALLVGGLEDSIGVEVAPTVLHLIAFLLQVLDPGVVRDRLSDLLANLLGALIGDVLALLRTDTSSQISEYFPFAAGLSDARPRDLRREDDTALGAGLSAATGLLIPGLCR